MIMLSAAGYSSIVQVVIVRAARSSHFCEHRKPGPGSIVELPRNWVPKAEELNHADIQTVSSQLAYLAKKAVIP